MTARLATTMRPTFTERSYGIPMDRSQIDLSLLRSPAGHPLRQLDSDLVCQGTGRRYPIVEGNARIYDPEDVPASLREESHAFEVGRDIADQGRASTPARRAATSGTSVCPDRSSTAPLARNV